MAFKLKEARAAGYTDAEIADYLSQQTNFDIKGARAAGYRDDEIAAHLVGLQEEEERPLNRLKNAAGSAIDIIRNGLTSTNFDPVATAQQREIEKSRSVMSAADGQQASQPVADPLVQRPSAQSAMKEVMAKPPVLDQDIAAERDRMAVEDFKQRGWVDEEGKTTGTGMVAKTLAERGTGLGQAMAFTGMPGTDEESLRRNEEIAQQLEERKPSDDTLGTAAYSMANGEFDRALDYLKQNAAAGAVDATISTLGVFLKPLRSPIIMAQGASEGGNAYRDSIESGMSEEAALGRAAFQALSASLTEMVGFAGADYLLGKLAKMTPKAKESLIKKAMASAGKAAGTAGAISFDEGAEEVINSIANDLADKYGFSRLDMSEDARARMQNPDILGNASESFVAGAMGGAVSSPIAAGASVLQDAQTLKAEQAVNYTLNTDQHQKLDDDELQQLRTVAEVVNREKPGAVDIAKVDAEIARRANLPTMTKAAEAAQRSIERSAPEALDAADILGDENANQLEGNAAVDTAPAEAGGNLGEGSVADLALQPGRGESGNAAAQPVPGSDAGQLSGDGVPEDTALGSQTEGSNSVESQIPPENEVNAHAAATSPINDLPEPTDAQKEAGNYKKGAIKVGGLNISVENPEGSVRRSKADAVDKWETTMTAHYGYIKGVKARAPDKEHVDVYVKPGTAEDYSGDVYVVNQIDPKTGKFDEPKVMIGYASQEEAEAGYRSNYTSDWNGLGSIAAVPMERFKEMLQDEKAFLKPVESKPDQEQESAQDKAPAVANQQLTTGAVKESLTDQPAGRPELRPLIEALIKRRAAANQVGKSRPFQNMLNKAKAAMNGEDIKPAVFKNGAVHFNRLDEETRKLLLDIHDAIKNKTMPKSEHDDEQKASATTAEAVAPSSKPKHTPEQIAKWAEEKRQRDLARMRETLERAEKEKQFAERRIDSARNSAFAKDFTDEEMDNIVHYYRSGDWRGANAEGNLSAINAIERRLKSDGVEIEHVSVSNDGKSKSLYVKVGNEVVRVSDHELPETAQREYNRSLGLNGKWDREVIVDDWRTTTIDDYLKKILSSSQENDLDLANSKTASVNAGSETLITSVPAREASFDSSSSDTGTQYPGMGQGTPVATTKGASGESSLANKSSPSSSSQNSSIGDDYNTAEKSKALNAKLDAMTDDEIRDLYQRANLAGAKRDIQALRDTLKQEHPDDIEPLLEAAEPSKPAEEKQAKATEGAQPGKSAPESPKTAIEDFGEKIGGARKDVWTSYKGKLKDALAEDVKAVPLSKSWPEPDYQALLDNGADPWAVAFAHAARDEVPTKPQKSWKLSSWVKQVEMLRDTTHKLMNGEFDADHAQRLMSENPALSSVYDRTILYQRVGHSQSLKGIRISVGRYSIFHGQEYNPPKTIWTVEKDAKATAFSNWPKQFVTGDTREAAIEEFVKKYSSLVIQKPAKKEISFDLYSKRGEEGFWIGKKIGRNYVDLERFDSLKEARAYRIDHHDDLVAKLEKFKEIPSVRRDINNPRVGEDMRGGQDVTPQMFSEAFGFRGVEFGNWVEQKKRQQDLNDAYDALMDMAAILGVPPKALSLNGELGLAFGARGSGGVDAAKAHYEQDFVVINLTKKDGAGSLGHEWWHALDNYFSRMRGKKSDYMTEALDVSLSSRGSVYEHRGEVRKEMVDAYGEVMKAIRSTALKARSSKLDAKRSKEYWTTSAEMSARAFESYLIAKLQDNNASNDYLANIVSEETWKAAESIGFELEDSYPYPTAGEIPAIRAAYDHFFNTIQYKETESGVALFSRKDSGPERVLFKPQAHEGYRRKLAEHIAMFKSGDQRKFRAAGNDPIPISRTPVVLRQVLEEDGSKPFKRQDFIVGQGSTLYLKATNTHSTSLHSGEISIDVLNRLPELLADPVAVFKSSPSSEDAKSFKVLIDAADENGNPVIVAVRPAMTMQQLNDERVNFQATIFPTTWKQIRAWNKDGLLRYYNDKSPRTSKPGSNPLGAGASADAHTGEGFDATIGVAASKVKVMTRSEIEGLPPAAWSRGAGRGMSPELVQMAVDRLKAKWENAPDVVVVNDMNDSRIRKAVRDENDRQLSQGATGQPEGFFDAGKVYIVASEMNSASDVQRVLFHEALGHYGLRGVFGTALDDILDQIYMARRKDVLKKAKDYGLDFTKQSDRRIAAEEVLAEMAQNNPQLGFVQRAIAAIRSWLRKMGFDIKMTDAEIIREFIEPARAFVQRGNQAEDLRDMALAFQRQNRTPSKASGDTFVTAAMEYLARDPELFRRPSTDVKDIYGIAKEIDPGYRVERLGPSMTKEKGADRAWEVHIPGTARVGYIMTKEGEVWIDVQHLQAGKDSGSAIYDMAAAYAHNNGKVLIGDPLGLSRIALYRRNENMLSSALKYGTTRHLRPHIAQEIPAEYYTGHEKAFGESVRPLNWIEGDDANNIREMIYNSWKAAIDHFPELKDVIYNPTSQQFERVTGEQFTDDDFAALLSKYYGTADGEGGSGNAAGGVRVSGHSDQGGNATSSPRGRGRLDPYRAGSATQKRAALFNTFLRSGSSEGRQQILGSLVDQLSRGGLAPSLRGIFYSRSKVDQTETPEFKRWFGDSKVVDADGKPLVVYHGTEKNINAFKSSSRGLFGEGIYLTTDSNDAEQYGSPLELYASIQRPFYTEADYDAGEEIDFDSPAVPFIREVFGVDAERILQKSIDGDGNFGSEVREALEAMGHDGIVVRWPDGTRHVIAFRPEQIKSATGNRGTFDPENPNILFSRSGSTYWEGPEESKLDTVIYTLQDKNIDLKRVTARIQDVAGQLEDRWDAYLQEELYHGRAAKRTKDFINDELEPLIEDMRQRGVSMTDFEQYLWARHAEERNIQIAKINPDLPDGGSGLTTQEARDYLASLTPADRKNYEALAARVDAITRKSRQILIDYGLESAETIKAWDEAYQHYVPLMREDMEHGFSGGTGQGFSVKGSASKRATGSTRKVVDILANIAQQRERNIIRGEKNRVATALIGLAKLNPNPDFWKTDTVPKIRTVTPGKTVYEVHYHGSKVNEFSSESAAKKFIEYEGKPGFEIKKVQMPEQVEDRPDPNYKNRPNVIVARIVDKKGNVVEHSVIFDEHDARAMRMAASLKNLDQDQIGELLGTASTITRYFASINTQYNPIFGIINILRDSQGAVLNLTSTELAGKQKEVIAATFPAMRGIYKDVRGRRKKATAADNEWARLWEEFQKEGGQTGYRDMFRNARERAEKMERALDPTWWQKRTWGKVISARGLLAAPEQWLVSKPGKAVFDWLSDYNETLENAVRLAAYKVGLDNGMSKQRAASLAKNLTVNFNRKGEMGRQIGALYAFFNASVQGTARIFETLAGPAGKRILAGGLLLGVMQAVALALAGFDDDEPPDFERDRNLIIPIGDGKYVKIAMPLGFNAIPAFGRIATEWALDGFTKGPQRMVHVIDMLMDVTNPIGNAGFSMQTLAPTALDPIAALTENKDWTGRQIARQDMSSLNPTPGHTRAKDTASAFGKSISYAINWLTGGTDFKPGAISPTPDQIDYLIGQISGGVGREYLKAEQTLTSAVTGENLPPHKIPLFGRFYGDTKGQSSQASEFYNNLRELNEHENEIKGRRKAGESVVEYRREHPETGLIQYGNLVERQVQALRRRKRELVAKGAPKEQIVKVDEQITTLMTRLNERMAKKKSSE